VDRIGHAIEHGRLTTNVRLFADAGDRRWLEDLLHQGLLTVLAGTTGLMAVLLLANDSGPRVTESVGLFAMLGYGLLVVSGVLGLRALVVVLRRT
jgi:ubiquinone biosynthesis protein